MIPLTPPNILVKRYHRSLIGFCDHEKVDRIPNATSSLVITATIANHDVLGFLICERNACNLMYLEIFKRLGLRMKDLKPCEERRLMEFNDSTTQSTRGIDIIVLLREGEDERRACVHFLIVPYECSGIPGQLEDEISR